jgi:predicted lipoprotein with Yx(FWY)xxD motif
MRNPRNAIVAIAVAAVVTVGGVTLAAASGSTTSAKTPGFATAPNSATAARDQANSPTVRAATATVQGKRETILVDAKGLPLYTYQADSPTTSRVTGQLAVLWPPLVAGPSAVRGSDRALTSVATTNGDQVAYNGHFLYTFTEDSPDHVTGQGVQDFFVATPGPASGTPTNTAPVSPSNSYGGY